MRGGKHRTKHAGSSSSATDEPSATSLGATRPRRRTASSSSSTTRRSGSRRTTATSWRSSTRTSPPPRARLAPTSRTSGSGRSGPTSSSRCEPATWPPSGSRAAGSRRSSSLLDREEVEHGRLVGLAVVLVLPLLQRDGGRLRPLERDGREVLGEAVGAVEPEVVDRRVVVDHERVGAGLQGLDRRSARVLERDDECVVLADRSG